MLRLWGLNRAEKREFNRICWTGMDRCIN